MFAYTFVVFASNTIVKSVRDALFIDKLGPERLPYVYVLAAIIVWIAYRYFLGPPQLKWERLTFITYGAFTLTAVAFAVLLSPFFPYNRHWLIYPLYIWSDIFGHVCIMQVWLVAGSIFNTQQAEGMYGYLFGIGTLGGLSASRLLAHNKVIGTESLLWFVVGGLFFCILLVHMIVWMNNRIYDIRSRDDSHLLDLVAKTRSWMAQRGIKERPLKWYFMAERLAQGAISGQDLGETTHRIDDAVQTSPSALAVIQKNKFLIYLAIISAAVTLTITFIDFQFKTGLNQHYETDRELTVFFGDYYSVTYIITCLLQLVVTRLILKRLGKTFVFLMPGIVAFTSFSFLFFPGLWALVSVRGCADILNFSFNKPGIEKLYTSIPDRTRIHTKPYIDVVIPQASKGLGGILLLLLIHGHVLNDTRLWVPSIFILAGLAVWLFVGVRLRRSDYSSSHRPGSSG